MLSDKIFVIDIHIHATQSRKPSGQKMTVDSLMNVENIVEKAKKLGLNTVGIMEHVEPGSGRHPWEEALHVKKLVDQLKEKVDFKLYSGCEASITDLQGNLSAAIDDLKSADFDYVIASVHSLPSIPRSIEEYHSLVIAMMENALIHNPYIDVIGHPWRDTPKILKRIGIDETWTFDMIPKNDIAELASAAKHAGAVLEISRPCFEMAGYPRFLRIAADAGGKFTIGSDAHQWDRFNLISQKEIEILKAAGINSANLKVW